MSSDTRERPESGSIESVKLEAAEVTTYWAANDGALVVEIEARRNEVRVYVNREPSPRPIGRPII